MHDLIDTETIGGKSIGEAAEAVSTQSLEAFCRAISEITADLPEKEIPGRIAALLPGILCQPNLLTPEQRTEPETGYDRHTIFMCPGDRFSVMAVVWPAGVYSPIHDHATWCAFGVYDGVVEETCYEALGEDQVDADGKPLARLVSTEHHRPGAVGHMPAAASHIHRMHNPGSQAAISIHVYGGNCEKQGPNVDKVYCAGS